MLRAAEGRRGRDEFKTKIPSLVDMMEDATSRAYAAWPSRIFLVDINGIVTLRGDPGPRGLVPAAHALQTWLEAGPKDGS